MLRAIAWICFSLFCLTACVTLQEEVKLPPVRGHVLHVFKHEYDRVWRATQKALGKYPIMTNNIETGVLETEIIRGEKGWRPAHAKVEVQPGLRYQIILKLVRGQTIDGVASTEVSIEKRMSLEKNFFSEGQKIYSEGLEEQSIIYRIQRELTLESALDSAYESGKI